MLQIALSLLRIAFFKLYAGRLREPGLFSLEKRGLLGNITAAFLKESKENQGDGARLSNHVQQEDRRQCQKLKPERFRLDIGRILPTRTVREMECVAKRGCAVSILGALKTQLDKALKNLV